MRRPGHLGHRGSVAVEYGIILPVFLLLVLGIVDVGRLMWTQTTLDRAVEAAARCGAVDAVRCKTVTQVQSVAVAEAYGLQIAASDFAVATAACGVEVQGSLAFKLIIPWIARTDLPLTARACYPL